MRFVRRPHVAERPSRRRRSRVALHPLHDAEVEAPAMPTTATPLGPAIGRIASAPRGEEIGVAPKQIVEDRGSRRA
jgi:hypothetical protein